MTGYELLCSRARGRGLKQTQINSQTFEILLSILADEDISAQDCLGQLKNKYHRLINDTLFEIKEKEQRVANREYALKGREDDLEFYEKNLGKKEEELAELNKNLLSFETPEARDRVRLAEYYKMQINPDTVVGWNGYSATAFVKAYGEILSGLTNTEQIGNEKSVDIKIPKVEREQNLSLRGLFK